MDADARADALIYKLANVGQYGSVKLLIAAALREVEREARREERERCAQAQCADCADGKPVTRVPIPHDGPDACRWMHLRADDPRVGAECDAAAIRDLADERRAAD